MGYKPKGEILTVPVTRHNEIIESLNKEYSDKVKELNETIREKDIIIHNLLEGVTNPEGTSNIDTVDRIKGVKRTLETQAVGKSEVQ